MRAVGKDTPVLASFAEVYGTPEQRFQARLDSARKISSDMDEELGISNGAKQMILKSFSEGKSVGDGGKTFYKWEDFRAHRIAEMTREKTPDEKQKEWFRDALRKSILNNQGVKK